MANHFTIARPYAKAALAEADADGQAENWHLFLEALACMVSDTEVKDQLNNPNISRKCWETCFIGVIEKALPAVWSSIKDKAMNFLNLLFDEKRLTAIPDIASMYHHYWSVQQNIEEVSVVSALALTKKQRENLLSALSKKLQKNINIDYKEDSALIGGMIIKSDRWVMDGSVKAKLSKLTDTLCE